MIKRLKQHFKLEDPAVTSLLTLTGVLAAAYFVFFVVLPQRWTFMDDYDRMTVARTSGLSLLQMFKHYCLGHMGVGRFKPVNDFLMTSRMALLPPNPRVFRLVQWLMFSASGVLFARVMLQLGLTPLRALVGVVIAASAFSAKDQLLYWTISEPLMLLFFFSSLTTFLSRRYWLSFVFFVLSFGSKEPALSFLGLFFLLAVLDRKRKDTARLFCLTGMSLAAMLFFAYLKTLPQIYTAAYKPSAIHLSTLLTAVIKPLARNYGVFIALAAALALTLRPKIAIKPLVFGICFALGYTLVLVPWGPFDSWFYLHSPIPYGWAIVLATFWPESTAPGRSRTWLLASIGALGLASMAIVINGSSNYRQFLDEGHLAAEIACEEHARNPNVALYANCQEPSGQFTTYLKLEKRCANPPKISYLPPEKLDSVIRGGKPYIFIASTKCDYAVPELPSRYRTPMRYWTIYKDYP